ncbi:MAG TPA: cyclic nucleotide-binding domain-containing protein [Cytophagales bacterium]|nr:cyclic nucleotide-binding domain-containing protein [Cytophagales bacterium]
MKVIKSLFNVEIQGNGKFLLLLAFGFFIGIFNVTFLVQSSSSFLNVFNEKVDLPKAIIFSGILGVISASVLSFLQSRVSFVKLTIGVLLIILFTITSLRIGYEYTSFSRELTFMSFVMVGPYNAVTMLVFWGIVGRLFSVKQTKRIIGSIDSGQLVGTIITAFSIPIILKFMFNSINLLIIGSTSIFIAIVIFFVIYLKYEADLIKINKDETLKREHKFIHLIKKKYVIAMAAFIVISMIATIFVDYSFLQVTAKNYPEEKDLAIFLARFEGTILIFSFLVQTFVTDRLIAMYGLKITLLVTPIVLLIFTVITMIVGFSMEYGDTFNVFILFFLSVSLSKLFNTALRDAIDTPTFKLYFLPFDSAIRMDVQTKIEGVVKLFAGLLAGLILISIEATSIFSVTHISVFLITIIGVWILVANKLHKKYKDTLQQTLANFKSKDKKALKSEYSLGSLLNVTLEDVNPKKIIQTLNLIEKLYPVIWEDSLKKVSTSASAELNNYALKKLNNLNLEKENLSKEISLSERDSSALSNNGLSDDFEIGNSIRKLIKSKKAEERVLAAKLFRLSNNFDHIHLLNELLKDQEKEVINAAIYTAKIIKNPETFSLLIELLGISEYSNSASAALISIGDEVIPALETAFHKPGQKDNVMYKIVYIYGQIGSDSAVEKMWQKIAYPDFHIVTLILRSFDFLKIKASEQQVNLVKETLENEIRKAAWNISAQVEIGEEEHSKYLLQALEEEINLNFDSIYILLSLLYEEQSIQLVRDNIDSGTSEGRVFALELLDIFIAKDIKTTLFPLLDDVPISEKVRTLQLHFPREIFDSVEVLKQIINRDYNNIGRWTKACALYVYALTPRAAISDDLTANFFNPNGLIRETAAWAVVKKDKGVFRQILTRISSLKRYENEAIVRDLYAFIDSESSIILRIEKILFLKKISFFSNLPGFILAELIDEIKEIKVKEGHNVHGVEEKDIPFYIVYEGSVSLYKKDKPAQFIGENEVIGDMELLTSEEVEYRLVSNENSLLFAIEKQKLYEVMNKHYQFAHSYISTLSNQMDLNETIDFSKAS